MDYVTKCPTCSSPVRVVGTPLNVSLPGDKGDLEFDVYTNHYEPLGLDVLERAVVEASTAERLAYRTFRSTPREDSVRRHREWAESVVILNERTDTLIAACAANVGKEAGE